MQKITSRLTRLEKKLASKDKRINEAEEIVNLGERAKMIKEYLMVLKTEILTEEEREASKQKTNELIKKLERKKYNEFY